jgi:hypothetical protein
LAIRTATGKEVNEMAYIRPELTLIGQATGIVRELFGEDREANEPQPIVLSETDW